VSEVDFLTVEDVLAIHAHQVERFGGAVGIRDKGLLASAVAQAEGAFEGAFLHRDLFEMAAAYHFHLVRNHPFVDGNKRVGLAAALVFLELNGVRISTGTGDLYELTMAVARGERSKREIAEMFRSLAIAEGWQERGEEG